jgi:cobalt-zinc-cadmium efflux system outer membrane protein
MSAIHFSRSIHCSVALAVLLMTAATRAHETTTPSTALAAASLTLAGALARASQNNPELMAQSYEERAAEALIEQAGLRPNPTLDVTAENFLGTGNVQGVRSLETTVQASQTFERGGKRDRRVALASRERESAAKAFAVRRAELLAEAAVAYVETLAAQERVALAEEPLALARETLAVVEARVKEGAASPAESARARAALASAQGEFARAQAALSSARASLAATWGGRAGEIGALSGKISVPETLPGEEVFLAQIGRHPRFEFQQAVVESRRASLELEKAQAAQDVTVGGGVRFLREGTDAAFVAGVSVPLPVRNKNQGNIRAARETLAGAEQSIRAVETELRAGVTAAWQELAAAHTTAHTLRRDALPATEEAHAVVRRAYEEGQLPLIDVLDAQRALVSLRREILDAESAYAVALARVEGLTNPAFTLTTALFSAR